MKKIFFLCCFASLLLVLSSQNTESAFLKDDSPIVSSKAESPEKELLAIEEDVDSDFQFDDDSDAKSNFSVSIGGGIYVGASPFFNSFSSFGDVKPTSLVWGNLHLEASAPLTKAVISSNLNNETLPFNLGEKWAISKKPAIPRFIDEAFLQVSIEAVSFSGGLKKVNWGRADALSVLDVINPKDKSRFYFLNEDSKMSVPIFQGIAYLPKDVKVEAVFLPIFEPDLFAIEGRWQSNSVYLLKEKMQILRKEDLFDILQKDTAKLRFAHGGMRLSTTIANSHDIAFQYFYGWSGAPLLKFEEGKSFVDYLQRHNIGLDYGVAVGPVNLKLEVASNIMGQSVQDSNFEWNAGLETSLTHGFSLQLIFKETAWLKNIKNVEHTNDLTYVFFRRRSQTDTVLLTSLSQNVLRGALEWKLLFLANLEDVDFLFAPSVHVIFGTIILDAQVAVFFGQDWRGSYSQYHKNNFLKLSIGYEF